MNRAVAGLTLLADEGDYAAFERVLAEARARFPGMRVCAYCLMPNHFHLVLWPRADDLLSRFMQWLTMTHTQRWHAHRDSIGRGHLYQSRFKSFPIEADGHFLTVCRYVERNALRAGLVPEAGEGTGSAEHPGGAEAWRWGSLAARADRARAGLVDEPWPVERPRNWRALVNRPQTDAELAAVRKCVKRGNPYGSPGWQAATAAALGLESTTRPVGRPKAGAVTN